MMRAIQTTWRPYARAAAFVGAWAVSVAGMAQASENVDLSGNHPTLAAAVPVVAVDPSRSGHIAVAWRFIDPLADSHTDSVGNWICHLSQSQDNGKTFTDRSLDWHLEPFTRCNAPWVGFSRRGELYLAATVTGTPPAHAVDGVAGAPAAPEHPSGTVAFMASRDAGRTWETAVPAIPSAAFDRFETDASIPAAAKAVPWDGARGAVDLSSGAIYLSGAFPARPGGIDHSQRFYSVSLDSGKSFGAIRAFGDRDWPERWDGDIAAGGGSFVASYIGDSASVAASRCPCVVIATSHDSGRTLTRGIAAEIQDLDLDTYVHYPEVAVDPSHRRLALVLIDATKTEVTVLTRSEDAGGWTRANLMQPADVTAVTRPSLAFSPAGVLVIAWRGLHADGSYDIYAAASADVHRFGVAHKISTASSQTPSAWLKTYAVRGDFHTAVAAAPDYAHLAWADARGGRDVRLRYARVALRSLLP